MPRAAIQIAIRSERSPKGLVQPVVAERLLGKLCSTERLSVLVQDDACSYGGPEAQTDSTERMMVSIRVCFNTRARMVVNFAAASPGQGAEDGAEEALGAQRAPQTQSSQRCAHQSSFIPSPCWPPQASRAERRTVLVRDEACILNQVLHP